MSDVDDIKIGETVLVKFVEAYYYGKVHMIYDEDWNFPGLIEVVLETTRIKVTCYAGEVFKTTVLCA